MKPPSHKKNDQSFSTDQAYVPLYSFSDINILCKLKAPDLGIQIIGNLKYNFARNKFNTFCINKHWIRDQNILHKEPFSKCRGSRYIATAFCGLNKSNFGAHYSLSREMRWIECAEETLLDPLNTDCRTLNMEAQIYHTSMQTNKDTTDIEYCLAISLDNLQLIPLIKVRMNIPNYY